MSQIPAGQPRPSCHRLAGRLSLLAFRCPPRWQPRFISAGNDPQNNTKTFEIDDTMWSDARGARHNLQGRQSNAFPVTRVPDKSIYQSRYRGARLDEGCFGKQVHLATPSPPALSRRPTIPLPAFMFFKCRRNEQCKDRRITSYQPTPRPALLVAPVWP